MGSNIRTLKRAAIVEAIYRAVDNEIERARATHPPLHSCHEAYAVLLEEMDEVKDAVWCMRSSVQPQPLECLELRDELVDVAAVAVRAILDLPLHGGLIDE